MAARVLEIKDLYISLRTIYLQVENYYLDCYWNEQKVAHTY